MAPVRRSSTRTRGSTAANSASQSKLSAVQERTRSDQQKGNQNGDAAADAALQASVQDTTMGNDGPDFDRTRSGDLEGTTNQAASENAMRAKKRKHSELKTEPGLPLSDSNPDSNGVNGSSEEASDAKLSKRAKVNIPSLASASLQQLTAKRDDSGKLPVDRSKLPGGLWQQVFLLSTPLTLARLARVNRTFHAYLIASPAIKMEDRVHDNSPPDVSVVEATWAASRKLHFPDMPKPLQGLSESDMWKLIASRHCQHCGKETRNDMTIKSELPWSSELGEDGTAPIWAFGVYTCGTCLVKHSQKEIDLMLSTAMPSSLLAALPFVFLTPSIGVVTATALRNATPAASVPMSKYFYNKHLNEIKNQFEHVKSLGAAATEEWFKGLQEEGNRRMSDCARWERWELSGGLRTVMAALGSRTAANGTTNTDLSRSTTGDNYASRQVGSPTGERSRAAQKARSTFSHSPDHKDPAHPPHGSYLSLRPGRSVHEANELKAARRHEIERRCLELDPPIEPNILNHMESFQNALQISTPLTDSAWAVLRPRLLAQREMAEQKETERIIQSRLLQAKYEERRQQEAHLKEVKEVLDREWDEAQSPIRELLGQYADEIINGRWKEGKTLTNDSSPRFAADVLIHVRSRFYKRIAEEDAAARAARQEIKKDSPNGPPTRRLILENMKWVFDTKIKPFTEQFRKELFLCHVCENSKFYGFEGVIQHYAAKHTNTLSLGSVVVHWRAEWPEYPPFHPDPQAARAAMYSMSHHGHGHYHSGSSGHGSYSQGPYPPSPGPLLHHPPRASSGFQHMSPGPYGPPSYRDQYSGHHQHGPFAPPAGYGPSGYPPPPPAYGPDPGYQGVYSGYAAQPGGYQGSPAQVQPYGSYPPSVYPAPPPGPPGPPVSSGRGHAPPTPYHPHGPVPPPPVMDSGRGSSGMYQTQLDYMAGIAREIWFGTSGIKDLPGAVRAFVVINRVVAKFKENFPNEPSLAMFIDGLNNHQGMKPIRNVNGLNCKVCNTGTSSSGSYSQPPPYPTNERRLYTLPALLSHFQTNHLERVRSGPGSQSRPDWKVDMLDLPERSAISTLMKAPGIDDQKLKIIGQAFPDIFPRPGTRPGSVTSAIQGNEDAPRSSWRGHRDGDQSGNTRGSHREAIDQYDGHYSERDAPHGTGHGDVVVLQHDDDKPGARRGAQVEPAEPRHSGRPVRSGFYGRLDNRPQSPVATDTLNYDDEGQPEPSTGRTHRNAKADQFGRMMAPEDVPDVHDMTRGLTHTSSPSVPRRASRERGATMGNGSEDGEVGADTREKVPGHEDSPHEGLSAAERFLNGFLPDADTGFAERRGAERGQTKLNEHDERRQIAEENDPHRVKISEVEPLQRGAKLGIEEQVTGQTVAAEGEDRSLMARESLGAPRDGRRTEVYAHSPQSGRPYEIAEGDARYVSHTVMYHDGTQTIDSGRRPRSRYERYGSYRRPKSRGGRSRSPIHAVHPATEEMRYRRSPYSSEPRYEQAYRARTPVTIVQDPYAAEASKPYPGPPVARYRAYEDPRMYEPTYAVPMEYVPVRRLSARSPPARGAYIVETPGQGAAYAKYPTYEEELQARPVYDRASGGGHVYRVDRSVYDNDGARRSSSNQYPRY